MGQVLAGRYVPSRHRDMLVNAGAVVQRQLCSVGKAAEAEQGGSHEHAPATLRK